MKHCARRPRGLVLVTTALMLTCLCGLAQQKQTRTKPKPCAATLDACMADGCEPAGTAHALLNQTKRNVPQSTATPILLTFDDFDKLQDKADELVGQKVTLPKAARNKLRRISLGGRTVGEGNLVEVVAFLVGSPHPNSSGESVNCRLKGSANNDFHIPVAKEVDDTEFDGIVVEMIPQDEHRTSGEWTIRKLTQVQSDERPVLIRGQLFYDNEHLVNDDEENPKGGQPKRSSLWEIHPVTQMLVCNTSNKQCDAANEDQWTPIERYAPGGR